MLDDQYKGCAIYEHCIKSGKGDIEGYVRGQITKVINDSEPETADDNKRIIKIKGGNLHIAVDETEAALIATGRPIYYRGGYLVEPIWRWEKTSEKNRQTLIATLMKLDLYRLGYMIAKHAVIYKSYNKKEQLWLPVDPPKDVREHLLNLGQWSFPTVKGIVNSPTMRPDGSLLTEQGYDSETQLWFKSTGDVELPPIPKRPTKAQATAALKVLKDLLVGFPFDNDVSETVALAATMTPVLRGAFDFTPIYLILAPEAGTGKTYLITVIAMIATGKTPMAVVGIEKKEEMEKRLSAAAFEAMPILSLNNLSFDLESDLLNQMVTEGIVGIRPFGKNDKLVSCDCRGMTVFANGNNIRVVGDMVRRTLTAHLELKQGVPGRTRI